MKRRITQIISLAALHSSWGPQLKWFCNPVLSCHSCPLSWFACPVGVLVHYSGYHLFPWFALGTLLFLGALFGRLFCGWVCPFGLLQDVLHDIPTKKITLPRWTSYIKYLVLALMVFLLPFLLGELTMFSFCRICPAATIQVALPATFQGEGAGALTLARGVRFGLLAVILVMAVFSSRSFCKVLCPIGALLAPLNYISFWKVRIPSDRCVSCSACDRRCPTSVEPSKRAIENIPVNRKGDCIVCHECKATCPVLKMKKSADAGPVLQEEGRADGVV